jgi:hypothetical protein
MRWVPKKAQIGIGVGNTFEVLCLANDARQTSTNIRGHTRYGLWRETGKNFDSLRAFFCPTGVPKKYEALMHLTTIISYQCDS